MDVDEAGGNHQTFCVQNLTGVLVQIAHGGDASPDDTDVLTVAPGGQAAVVDGAVSNQQIKFHLSHIPFIMNTHLLCYSTLKKQSQLQHKGPG